MLCPIIATPVLTCSVGWMTGKCVAKFLNEPSSKTSKKITQIHRALLILTFFAIGIFSIHTFIQERRRTASVINLFLSIFSGGFSGHYYYQNKKSVGKISHLDKM
jgi:hypothetical protein